MRRPQGTRRRGMRTRQSRQGFPRPKTKVAVENYELEHIIGSGGYSKVYVGIRKGKSSKKYAVKVNFSTSPAQQVLSDIKFMIKLKDYPRFPKLVDALITDTHVYIVQEYFEADNFWKFLERATLVDIKHYFMELLLALKCLKKQKIYHRDVKPGNFLYNSTTRKGVLIDFGVAEPSNESKGKVTSILGTRSFMALEILLRQRYSFSSQMWSVGVIMLMFATRKCHTFSAHSGIINKPNLTISSTYLASFLMELQILYKGQVVQLCKKYRYKLKLPKGLPSRTFTSIVLREDFNNQAMDLLQRLLDLNPATRISVQEAIEHSFFDQVRESHSEVVHVAEATSSNAPRRSARLSRRRP